jgi:(p)ppGpp synthase/HD superfamily hydrolase
MGIAIHRDHCPNISVQSERHIGVTWTSTDQGIRYPVNLKISAVATPSIMVEIINYISSTNAVVVNVNTKQNKDSELLVKLGLSVFNADQLDKIIVGLRNFTDVFQVERTFK